MKVMSVTVSRVAAVLLVLLGAFPASASETIRSKAAMVMEAATGRVLYGKNPNLRLPPASTTKLMTAMVVLDRAAADDVVVISERAANMSPIKAHFRAGERVTVKTLLDAALMKSANDAALALAEHVAGSEEEFVELMNHKTIALGLSDTRFQNSTGLPGPGQYSTVYDLSRLMRHALQYQLLREALNTRTSTLLTEGGRSIQIRNINRLLWEDGDMVGGKTGYTREARHCFVCAGSSEEETLIVALLGTPSRELLWRETEELFRKGAAVRSSAEEAVIFFTRSDYQTSVLKASYSKGSPEVKKAPVKKAKQKAKTKTKAKVKAKVKSKTKAYAKKQKNHEAG